MSGSVPKCTYSRAVNLTAECSITVSYDNVTLSPMLSHEVYDSIPLTIMEYSAVDLTTREYVHFGTEPDILMNMKRCINDKLNVLN